MATDDEYMTYDTTKYGLDVYDVNCDLGQRVHEDISAYRDEQTDVSYDSSPGVRRKSKKLAALSSLHKVATRSLSIQQTAQLSKACSIKYGETVNVRFSGGEKLTIMFMYNNTYAVYRKSDGTVAILTNAQFQGNPPAMLDGSKYGNLLSEVEFLLMYAVAKTDHSSQQGLKFHQNDVILILAECRDTYVGITARKRVGIFPSKLVHIITQRRMCIFNGMVLRMTPNSNIKPEDYYGSNPHYDTTVYEITKSPNGLFSFVTHDGYDVSLYALIEKAITAENTNGDNIYETINEVSYCGTTLQEKKRMPLPQPGEGKDSASQGDSSLQGEIWFHGDLSREQAENVLKEDGDFLVRFMSNFPWVYVLSCKTKTGYEHFRLRLNNRSYYHTNGGDFRSIRNLIHVHQNEGQPVSKDPSTVIRRAVPNTTYQAPPLDELYEDYEPPSEARVVENDEKREAPKPLPRKPITGCGGEEGYERVDEIRENEMDFMKEHSVKSLITVFSSDASKSGADSDIPFHSPPSEEKSSEDRDCGDGDDYEPVDEIRENEMDFINDNSVKSLITVFSSDASKSGADIPFHSPPSEEKSSEDEILSTDLRGNFVDGLPVKRENEFSSSSTDYESQYILEMQTIKEEIISLKSLLQSVLKMGVHPEFVEQSKTFSKSTSNLSEFTDNTDEEVEVTNEPPKKETLSKSINNLSEFTDNTAEEVEVTKEPQKKKTLSKSINSLSEYTDNTAEEVEVTKEPQEKEAPKSKLSDDHREQVTLLERAGYDMTGRSTGETANEVEIRKLKEEMNFLKSRLESLVFRNADFQPQILETYLPCKENEQCVGGNTKEATATSQHDESYIDNIVEYHEENPNQRDLLPEEAIHNDTGKEGAEKESIQRRKHLMQELQPYWQMEITAQLRDIVAMYLEPEFFHEVGKKLGVHKNRRTQIEREKTDIVERTYELLGQWHQKQGHMATIGKLIESLEPFNPEDFNALLEDFYDEVEDNYSKFT